MKEKDLTNYVMEKKDLSEDINFEIKHFLKKKQK